MRRGEVRARQCLAELAERAAGTWEARDFLDDDGITDDPVPVRVRVTVTPEAFVADFTGSSPQVRGTINCTWPSTVCTVRNIFIALADPHFPANEGFFRPVRVIAPEGTVFNARRPAPVSTYWESMSFVEDLIWQALAGRAPHRLTAGHYLSVCAAGIGGVDDRTGEPFYMLEPMAGGWGAGADTDGESALICSGDGETYTVPVEVAETRHPVRVRRFALHPEGGGAGTFRGGLGLVREYELLNSEGFVSAHFGRFRFPPWGVAGGRPGTPNRVEVYPAGAPEPAVRAGKLSRHPLRRGDLVRLITGSGGGWGDPSGRSPERIREDLRAGYLTHEQARRLYGRTEGVSRDAAAARSPG